MAGKYTNRIPAELIVDSGDIGRQLLRANTREEAWAILGITGSSGNDQFVSVLSADGSERFVSNDGSEIFKISAGV